MQLTQSNITHPLVKDIASGILYSVLIFVVMLTIPLIGLFAWVLLPLPLLFYRLKIGRHAGAVILAVSIAIVALLTGSLIVNGLYLGSLMLTGLFLGECIEKNLRIEKTMIYTGLGLAGLFAFSLFFAALVQSQGIDQLVTGYIARYQAVSNAFFEEFARQYPDLGMDRQVFEQTSILFMTVLPSVLVCTYLCLALLNILLIRRLLKRHSIVLKQFEHLNRWQADDKLVFVFIGLSLMMFAASGGIKILLVNCLIIVSAVYFFQGLAIASYFFDKKQVPFLIKSFFFVLIAIQPFFMMMVVGCGLFDTWINFRKIDTDVKRT